MTMNAKLKVLRSDLTLQVAFSQPLWQLFHNIPALYGALLKHLGERGLRTADIRTDAGDGTLGGFNVNFWLLNLGMLVRLRLESVEVQADLNRVAADQLAPATDALLKAVRMASPELKFLTYSVTLGIHGHLNGANINEFLAKFTTNAPAGSGPVVGSGCVFSYGQQDPIITSALTLEPSSKTPYLFGRRQRLMRIKWCRRNCPTQWKNTFEVFSGA